MDVLDEINGKIEELCAIAERERERVLEELICVVNELPGGAGNVAELALDYASWTRTLEGYRSLLRRADAPIARMR